MARAIIKITDPVDNKAYYLDWSTIVDAPVTWGMTLGEYKEYFKTEYPKSINKLDEMLQRVELTGSSSKLAWMQLTSFLDLNFAGKDGEQLDLEGILHNYCRNHLIVTE